MSANELTSRIRELRALQALIEEATAEAETIKEALKLHMGTAEELRVGEYKVSWKTVQSSCMDTSALKKAMPDTYAAFCKTTTTRRFCVA